MKFIDLFCGVGGFHQALIRMDHECVFACDIDKECRKTYKENYNLEPESDITKISEDTVPDHDIICAGFPCQAFSNAGKKKSLDDKRGKLFHEILRIAKHKNPKFMFLENVKHIKRIDDGKVFEYIIDEINKAGYIVDKDKTIFELSPHQLGIPQQRERVIFVCIRKDIYSEDIKIEMPIPDTKIDFNSIIEQPHEGLEKYKITDEIEHVMNVWQLMIEHVEVGEKLSPVIMCNEFHSVYTDEEFAQLPVWKQDYITRNKPIYNKYKDDWDVWYQINHEILQKREIYGKLEWQAGPKKENDSIFNYFISFRQSGIRVKKAKYFPTLVAMVQTPIYGKEKRYITPRECARLQSFPDSFKIHSTDRIAYKQFGNAVNVDVIHKVVYQTFLAYNLL